MMKKETVITVLALALTLTACGQAGTAENDSTAEINTSTSEVLQEIQTEEHADIEADNISDSGTWQATIDEENLQAVWLSNLADGTSKEITVQDSLLLATKISELRWFEQDKLAVISHVNPSLEWLAVYDAGSSELVAEKYGIYFQWAGDCYSDFYYIEPTPHFSEEIGIESIKNYEDEIIYQTSGGESLSKLAVSPNGKKLGFFSQSITESGKITHLNILSLNNTANQPLIVEWNDEIGELYWKDEDNLNISHETYEIELDANDGSITSKVTFGDN